MIILILYISFLNLRNQAIRADRQKKVPQEWGEEEIVQLTELWERMKDDRGIFAIKLKDALHSKNLDLFKILILHPVTKIRKNQPY